VVIAHVSGFKAGDLVGVGCIDLASGTPGSVDISPYCQFFGGGDNLRSRLGRQGFVCGDDVSEISPVSRTCENADFQLIRPLAHIHPHVNKVLMRYAAASCILALSMWLVGASAAPLNKQPNSQAIAFVVAVATSDLRSARGGGEHVFAYAPDESEATLSSAIKDWLSHGDKPRLRLAPADQATIFAFHWAATRMPAQSRCFMDIDSEECQQDLGYWLARVRDGDPEFVSAYRQAQMRLSLPPLATQRHD
jgi:hypothetical protein